MTVLQNQEKTHWQKWINDAHICRLVKWLTDMNLTDRQINRLKTTLKRRQNMNKKTKYYPSQSKY